jgi:hypothetical protein
MLKIRLDSSKKQLADHKKIITIITTNEKLYKNKRINVRLAVTAAVLRF